MVLYQPQVDLELGTVVAAEALMRWQHPTPGLLSPADFLPIAEDSGLILEPDRWVRGQVLTDVAGWARAGLPPVRLAVNLSARELRNRYLPQDIQQALLAAGVPASQIELEVTDRVVLPEAELIAALRDLTSTGVRLAIDDFGTGSSVLTRLDQFPIDTLKIDRSFISQSRGTDGATALARLPPGTGRPLQQARPGTGAGPPVASRSRRPAHGVRRLTPRPGGEATAGRCSARLRSAPMSGRWWGRRAVPVLLAAAAVAGCSSASGEDRGLARADAPDIASRQVPEAGQPDPVAAADPGPVAAAAEPEAPAEVATTASPVTEAPPPPPRAVHESAWAPFASVEGLVLLHPAALIELIGYHEASHSGARDLGPLETSVAHTVLETRDRGTGARSAADIVVHPEADIRAPVTGRIVRAGTYVLYCDHSDDFAVIEPDARPGWEVKILHIDGVQVRAGDRVEAGVTVLAPRPTPLPFESQVDELTAEPSWPHVHVEVVDPSIPNEVRSGRSC